jgi:hypothetical protein
MEMEMEMEMERGFVYTTVYVGRSIGHVFLAVGFPESPLPMIQDQSLKYRSRPVGSWTDERTNERTNEESLRISEATAARAAHRCGCRWLFCVWFFCVVA